MSPPRPSVFINSANAVAWRGMWSSSRRSHWRPIAEANFRSRWDEEAAEARNELDQQTITIATGLLLPVWDKLPDDAVRVWRIADTRGFSQLGRIVPAHAFGRLAEKFGVDAVPRLSVDETIAAATGGEGAPLPTLGTARLRRALVNGDVRLEIRDYPPEKREWLKSLGCFVEIIQYRTRLFVPVDRAAVILGVIAAGDR